MKIRTRYTTTPNGAGRIVATAMGRRRSVPYAHELSRVDRHGLAAQTLADALGSTLNAVPVDMTGTVVTWEAK